MKTILNKVLVLGLVVIAVVGPIGGYFYGYQEGYNESKTDHGVGMYVTLEKHRQYMQEAKDEIDQLKSQLANEQK